MSVMSGIEYYRVINSCPDERKGGNESTNHDRGVVDEDVDPAPSLDDTVDDPLAAGFFPDVLREEEALLPGGSDQSLSLLGIDLLLG